MPKSWGENPKTVTLASRGQSPLYSTRDPQGNALVNLPGFMSGMALFESRELTGATSGPADGLETLQTLVDTFTAPLDAWATTSGTPGTGGLETVITAWCGGAGDQKGARLFISGGGHNDGANNGFYEYSFAPDANGRPTGWRLLPGTLSDPADVPRDTDVAYVYYNDGLVAATHTYDGIDYDPINDRIHKKGGAPWRKGIGSVFRGHYDLATGQWTEQTGWPNALIPGSVMDQSTGKALFYPRGGSSASITRPDGTSVGQSINNPTDTNGYSVLVHDTNRGRVYVIGSTQNKYLDVDFANETIAGLTPFQPTGATEILDRTAPFAVYDDYEDCFWLWGSTGTELNDVYRMDATSLNIEKIALRGSIPTNEGGYVAPFNRCVWLPQWGALAVVTHHLEAPHIVRLRTV